MKIHIALPTSVLVALSLTACGPSFVSRENESIASDMNDSLACADARAKIFDTYYKAYGDDSGDGLSSPKKDTLLGGKTSSASSEAQKRYLKSAESVHQIMTEEVQSLRQEVEAKVLSAKANSGDEFEEEQDPVLHLARLEMRSQIEPQYDELNFKLDAAFSEAAAAATAAGLACADNNDAGSTPDTLPTTPSDQVTSNFGAVSDSGSTDVVSGTRNTSQPVIGSNEEAPATASSSVSSPVSSLALATQKPLYGALRTMATAYQSCSVLELAPVSSRVESAQGVRKGESIDGVGYGREYTDVAALKRTHYYHRGQTYGAGCAVQDKRPLVYDYGGQPIVNGSTLDMFRNSGGGGALGIDCSAFIATAAGVAGNLYKTSTANKPYYTRFVSRDFISPSASGWSCYDSVSVNGSKSIQEGDIAAVQGHVVMVDKVGADPFGLSKITSASRCDSMSFSNFDFTIIQSSPEKNSIGINRFAVKDYLTIGGKMATMFLGYAKQACKSKFDGAARKPGTSTYGIIRHKQTTNCLAPKIALVNESCVDRCPTLAQ